MSSPAFLTPQRIALISAGLFVSALARAYLGGGADGALGVIEFLKAPLLVVAILLASQLLPRAATPSDPTTPALRWNRRATWGLLIIINIVLLIVTLMGMPFIAAVTPGR
jgi:hypothetical protein